MTSNFKINGEIYHVFNRGVEKRPTFTDKKEYERAIKSISYYRFNNLTLSLAEALKLEKEKRNLFFLELNEKGKELVEIICYCLMPNHFHLLLRQLENDGIKKFLSNFSNSYTRYFNTKKSRVGPLFQGIFKSVRIEDNDQLIYVSRYIHINPVTSFVIEENSLEKYPWSSIGEYLGLKTEGICHKDVILELFDSLEKYKEYLYDQIDYLKKLESVSHLLFE